MKPHPRKHSHTMMINKTPTLNPLIEPPSSKSLFINRNRECLAAAAVSRVNERNVEFIGMLGEVVCTGHAYQLSH